MIFFLAFVGVGLLLLGSLLPIAGGYQIRIVESGSMSPTITLGSVIVVRAADTYAVGDIATYQRIEDDEVTTHRIVATEVVEGTTYFTVQGDANDTPDQRPVEPQEIVGKVIWHVPFLGYVLDFVQRPLGFAMLVGIPAALIVYEQAQRIAAEVRKTRVYSDDTEV